MRTSNADACPLMSRMHRPDVNRPDLLGVRLQRQRVGDLVGQVRAQLDQLVGELGEPLVAGHGASPLEGIGVSLGNTPLWRECSTAGPKPYL